MKWPWIKSRKKKQVVIEKGNYKNIITAKTENGETINIGTTVNVCLSCGETIPEGVEICPVCESVLEN